jgi:hypothetical protein
MANTGKSCENTCRQTLDGLLVLVEMQQQLIYSDIRQLDNARIGKRRKPSTKKSSGRKRCGGRGSRT